jgi:hypothetical protein
MTLMTETVSTDRPPVAFSTALQKARDRQRVGTGAAPRLQPDTSASSKPKA